MNEAVKILCVRCESMRRPYVRTYVHTTDAETVLLSSEKKKEDKKKRSAKFFKEGGGGSVFETLLHFAHKSRVFLCVCWIEI